MLKGSKLHLVLPICGACGFVFALPLFCAEEFRILKRTVTIKNVNFFIAGLVLGMYKLYNELK